jgi:hypothetical protein
MKWAEYRYASLNLLAVAVLALLGGWAAFSGSMAMIWLYHPDRKSWLLEFVAQKHLAFFPPLFGSSPKLYMAVAFCIVVVCWLAVFILGGKVKSKKDVGASHPHVTSNPS